MKVLKKTLATIFALCMLTVSVFALDVQRQNDPKPPDKKPQEIKPQEKPPPPRDDKKNENRGGNENKRGKP